MGLDNFDPIVCEQLLQLYEWCIASLPFSSKINPILLFTQYLPLMCKKVNCYLLFMMVRLFSYLVKLLLGKAHIGESLLGKSHGQANHMVRQITQLGKAHQAKHTQSNPLQVKHLRALICQILAVRRESNIGAGAPEPHGTLGTCPNLILGNELPFPKI